MLSVQSMLRTFLIIIFITGTSENGDKLPNIVQNKGVVAPGGAKGVGPSKIIAPSKIPVINRNNKNDIFKPIANQQANKNTAIKKDFAKQVEEKINGWMVGLKGEITGIFGTKQAQVNQPKVQQNTKPVVIAVNKPKVVVAAKKNVPLPVIKNGQGGAINMGMDKGIGVQLPKIMQAKKPAEQPVKEEKNEAEKVYQMIKDAKNAIQPLKQTGLQKDGGSIKNLNVKKNGLTSKIMVPEDKEKSALNSQINSAGVREEEPIQIVWEIGSIDTELHKLKRDKEFTFVKQLMIKADSLLKMYVKIPKEKKQLIRLTKGKRCGFNLPKDIVTNAHVLMLCRFFEPKVKDEEDVVARSIYCQKGTNNRAIIGVLEINIHKLVRESAPLTHQRNFITTLVHESMHTLAFHGDWKTTLANREIKREFENLNLVKRVNPEIWEEGHWKDPYIPHDIMAPITSSAGIVSIFSLELMEHQSSDYIVQRKNLPYNNFLSTVTSVEDFLSYRCKDPKDKPKYSEFCSTDEVQNDVRKCSPDYIFKTYCDNNLLTNNCYQRRTFSHGNCLDTVVDPNFADYAFEHRGTDSRCFMDDSEMNSYCLKYEVVDRKVNLILGSASYSCDYDEQIIAVKFKKEGKKGYNFKIKCPNIADFIDQNSKTSCPNNCNWNGFCSKGQCLCFDGYDPKDNCKTQLKTIDQTMIFTETMA